LFFLDGKKVSAVRFDLNFGKLNCRRLQVHELKGVNAPELRTQVDLLLYQAFPRKFLIALLIIPTNPTPFSSPTHRSLPPIRRTPLHQPHPLHQRSSTRYSKHQTIILHRRCPLMAL
jgi:hypothetical protein